MFSYFQLPPNVHKQPSLTKTVIASTYPQSGQSRLQRCMAERGQPCPIQQPPARDSNLSFHPQKLDSGKLQNLNLAYSLQLVSLAKQTIMASWKLSFLHGGQGPQQTKAVQKGDISWKLFKNTARIVVSVHIKLNRLFQITCIYFRAKWLILGGSPCASHHQISSSRPHCVISIPRDLMTGERSSPN